MSVINQIPFLETLLNSLEANDLKELKKCIDGKGAASVFITLKPYSNNRLNVGDKGIKPVTLEVTGETAQSVFSGYLIYNDDYCVVINYSSEKAQLLTLIKIDPKTFKHEFINCLCSILELRSELNDRLVSAGELVSVDPNDITSVEAGEPLPAGKVLLSDGTGAAEWGEAQGGGTKLYRHYLRIGYNTYGQTLEEFTIEVINNIATPYNTNGFTLSTSNCIVMYITSPNFGLIKYFALAVDSVDSEYFDFASATHKYNYEADTTISYVNDTVTEL